MLGRLGKLAVGDVGSDVDPVRARFGLSAGIVPDRTRQRTVRDGAPVSSGRGRFCSFLRFARRPLLLVVESVGMRVAVTSVLALAGEWMRRRDPTRITCAMSSRAESSESWSGLRSACLGQVAAGRWPERAGTSRRAAGPAAEHCPMVELAGENDAQ